MLITNHDLDPTPRLLPPPVEPSGNVHWTVPRNVNNMFTGRSELIDRIRVVISPEKRSPTQEQSRFVITGMGGQGKSEVCLKVAHLMQEESVFAHS